MWGFRRFLQPILLCRYLRFARQFRPLREPRGNAICSRSWIRQNSGLFVADGPEFSRIQLRSSPDPAESPILVAEKTMAFLTVLTLCLGDGFLAPVVDNARKSRA